MRATLVPILIVLACGSGCAAEPDPGRKVPLPHGGESVAERYRGLPQRGASLGSATARYTMVEFADLQCPFCARFHRHVLPLVIERYVRPGLLRLELRPVAFLGADSPTAAAAAVAAGLQDRMWQFADLFYRNQGRENSGYVTPAFLGRIAAAVPGLDIARFNQASGTARLVAELERNARSARTAGITGTPGFRLGPTGGALTPFSGGQLERPDFLRRLAARLDD